MASAPPPAAQPAKRILSVSVFVCVGPNGDSAVYLHRVEADTYARIWQEHNDEVINVEERTALIPVTGTKPQSLYDVIDGKGETVLQHVRLGSARRCAKTWNETVPSRSKLATVRKAWLVIPIPAGGSARPRKVVQG